MNEFKNLGDDPSVLSFLRDIQSLQKGPEASPTEDEEEGCTLCDGYGHIVTPDDVKICECLRKRQSEKRLLRANIPAMYRRKTLDTFKTDTDSRRISLRQARRFVQEFSTASESPGLFLYGAPGTGKTHLAIGALKELIQAGYSGIFFNMVALMDLYRKQAVSGVTQEEDAFLEKLPELDIVVLDDLGAGRLTDFIQERIYSLIDYRYSNNRCVIVTSNLGLRKLEEQVTYPVLSRVRGMCFTVNTGEDDFRNPDIQIRGKK